MTDGDDRRRAATKIDDGGDAHFTMTDAPQPTPAPYPSQLVERWTAADGTTLLIRPIRGDDESLEQAFIDRLSRDTSYRRLLSGRTPQPDEIARWTHIDYRTEMALVAVDERGAAGGEAPRLCGVTRYVCETSDTAAFAIVLADDWQGRGLGTKLLTSLVDAARAAGIEKLRDITLSTNHAMITLACRLGFRVARAVGDPTISLLELSVKPTAP